jgi:ubiquinone/menaquinone biosynthesis C-methylase UbiE
LTAPAHDQDSDLAAIDRAFSKQSGNYDHDDILNPVLSDMRQQVYGHVEQFLSPKSNILELNAGTGIDAMHFARLGHIVHATDLSGGMIKQISEKTLATEARGRLTFEQLSFLELDKLQNKKKFDFIFSNFGGLNCTRDLAAVTKKIPMVLKRGGYVTWVIMPPVCLWELAGFFKGNFRNALRRFSKTGAKAHLEGEYFRTFYHSLNDIKSAFGPSFSFIKSEGLGALIPQPHRSDFPLNNPLTYRFLKNLDSFVRPHFPFNRWADHIIVTFRLD